MTESKELTVLRGTDRLTLMNALTTPKQDKGSWIALTVVESQMEVTYAFWVTDMSDPKLLGAKLLILGKTIPRWDVVDPDYNNGYDATFTYDVERQTGTLTFTVP